MTAVIPSTQLTAQTLSGAELNYSDANAVGNGKDALSFLFADILAQQLGISKEDAIVGDAIPDKGFDVDKDGDAILDVIADQGLMNPAQQDAATVIPQQVLVASTALPATPAQGFDSQDVAPAPISEPKAIGVLNTIPRVVAGEGEDVERQPVAVGAADIAGNEQLSGVQFSVPAENLIEQSTGRTQAVGITANQVAAQPQQPITGTIAQPVSSPAWGDMLGGRVMWMVGQQQQGAELRLNPPALGPLEVKLDMANGQATLTFSTQHLPVKEALEAATPRLREMFNESGISLGNVSVNVSTSSHQHQAEPQPGSRNGSEWNGHASDANDIAPMSSVGVTELKRQGSGMVDYFA